MSLNRTYIMRDQNKNCINSIMLARGPSISWSGYLHSGFLWLVGTSCLMAILTSPTIS